MRRTNPNSLRSYFCFRVFRLNFASDFFNLLLVRFHQAEITVVKRLIQERNNEASVGVEPLTMRSWSSYLRCSQLTRPLCRQTKVRCRHTDKYNYYLKFTKVRSSTVSLAKSIEYRISN